MSRRAFVDDDRLDGVAAGDVVILPVDVAHRFFRVLRLQDGAPIELLDDAGRVVRGTARAPDAIAVMAVDVVDDVLGERLVASVTSPVALVHRQ